jgi:epoxyqueuosine reductase QueG-like protein
VTAAEPIEEAGYYHEWVASGFAGKMAYLTDRRAGVRNDPKNLLPQARTIICVGKLYNGPQPYSNRLSDPELAWVSRYAWGEDYHDVMRDGLARLVERLRDRSSEPFEWKICVDTAPLLERAYARRAGLGWIGKNTCLINQQMGSWFFFGRTAGFARTCAGHAPAGSLRHVQALHRRVSHRGDRSHRKLPRAVAYNRFAPVHCVFHDRAAWTDSGRIASGSGQSYFRM